MGLKCFLCLQTTYTFWSHWDLLYTITHTANVMFFNVVESLPVSVEIQTCKSCRGMKLEGLWSSSRDFFSSHYWSQKVASSWLRSRDAGLVGRLTVGDDTENKRREGERKWRKQTFCRIHTHMQEYYKCSFSGSVSTHSCENTHWHHLFYTNTHVENSHTVCTRHKETFSHIHTNLTQTWKKTWNTYKNTTKREQGTTYFSTLTQVLVRKRASGLCRQGPFFSFPVVRVCD